MIQNLLQQKEEMNSKEAYFPSAEDAEYLAELQSRWLRSLWYHQTNHRYFNDKSLLAYMERASDDSFLYVAPTQKDNWHSKTRRQTPREKFNAIISAIQDQDLTSDIYAWDDKGEDARQGADVAQSLVAHSDYLEDAQEKRKQRAHELLKYGTCANEVSWRKTLKVVKKMKGKWDPSKGDNKWSDGEMETEFEGVWTKIIPLNRVLLGDITKYFIEEQPYIWKEYVMTYEEAYNLFHEWENWKYVPAVGPDEDTWNDTIEQVDTEQGYANAARNFVRMRVYENKWTDECAIVLNGVLMTKPGFPLMTPDKEYSLTWTELEPFDQAFAYGRSFFAIVHNDSVILDFLYNALVDKARQGLEPPIITSFKNLMNKNMFAPGKVTQGDINFKPAVLHQGVTTADIDMTRFVEENISKSSVSPVIQGQGQAGGQTAYEIREQQKNALRMLGLTLYSIARMERDIAQKKLAYILRYYPEMKVADFDKKSGKIVQSSKTFVVRGDQVRNSGVGRREIVFGKPEGDVHSLMKGLMDLEDKSAVTGEKLERVIVPPELLRNLKYVFQVVVNPSQRKSKVADAVEAREDAQFALSLPTIDPVWATSLWLRSKDYNEEEALRKQDQMQAPMAPPTKPGGKESQMQGLEQAMTSNL